MIAAVMAMAMVVAEPEAAAPPPTPAETQPEPESESESEPESESESEPESESESESESDPEPDPDSAPRENPGALGGHGYVPLPAAPAPSTGRIQKGPWRGNGWFQIRIDFVAPVGGKTPARGNVLTGAGGAWFGWRLHPLVGLHGGVTTFIHDRGTVTVFDDAIGENVEVAEFGRMTLVDVGVLRAFIPVPGRIQPYFDVGGFVGAYRAPFSQGPRATGGGRFGVGVDFWLGPTFTLSIAFDERLIVVGRNVGHTLQTGVAAGVHW